MRIVSRGERDRAAAVVEFALVGVVLMFTFLAVLQVAVYVYMRNVLQADVAHAARLAAASGADPQAAVQRAQQLITDQLGGSVSRSLTCAVSHHVDAPSGYPMVTVRCSGPVNSFVLPIGSLLTIDVRSSVLLEPAQ